MKWISVRNIFLYDIYFILSQNVSIYNYADMNNI